MQLFCFSQLFFRENGEFLCFLEMMISEFFWHPAMKNYPIDESSDSELHPFSSHRNANLMGAVTVNTSPQCSNVAASIFNTVLLVCVAPRSKRERTSSSIYSAELTITGYSTLSLQKWRKNVSFFVSCWTRHSVNSQHSAFYDSTVSLHF